MLATNIEGMGGEGFLRRGGIQIRSRQGIYRGILRGSELREVLESRRYCDLQSHPQPLRDIIFTLKEPPLFSTNNN